MTVVLFLGITWFFHKPQATHLPLLNSAALGLMFAFMYCGWKFLTNLFPTMWIGSGLVWLILTVVKFIAAYFVGLIVGPIQVIKALRQICGTSRIRHQIANSGI